ncbi:hypothetical protein N3K66_005093 [Trichothecium roseum]|uniref:Uncharacterized protein n=1 Tax=Trichothecium roseum TaxID=47278 RepID=A0ACC0V5T9_9HYPO|nr:hypothetical protein N3K66_005093 [Trichothecium roseum]
MPPRLSAQAIGGGAATPKNAWSFLRRTFASDFNSNSPPPNRNNNNNNNNKNNNNNNRPSSPSSTASLLGLGAATRNKRSGPLNLRNQAAASQRNQGRPGGSGIDAVTRLHSRYSDRHKLEENNIAKVAQQARERAVSASYLRHMPRRWGEGDVYSPTELSPRHQKQWRKRPGRNVDLVDVLGLRPVDMYKNFSLIQSFTRTDGYIAGNHLTSLRPVNQRKVAKMVRRAQGMGIYPTVHAHPEILRNQFFPPNRFGRS